MPETKPPAKEMPPEKKSLAAALASGTLSGTDFRATLSGLYPVTQIPPQPNEPERRAFHAAAPDAVARYWSTSIDGGLTEGEAERRLARLGPNKLTEKPGPTLRSEER